MSTSDHERQPREIAPGAWLMDSENHTVTTNIPATHVTDAQRAGVSEEAWKKLSDEEKASAVREANERDAANNSRPSNEVEP